MILANNFFYAHLSRETFTGKSRKHLPLSAPRHNWTATIPKIAKMKKHIAKTFHNIGNVSNNNVTRIRIPEIKKNYKYTVLKGNICKVDLT